MTRILKRGWNIPIERNKTDKKTLNYLISDKSECAIYCNLLFQTTNTYLPTA